MRSLSLVLLAAWLALAACARDPLDTPCPDVDVGGLVLSEIRQQTGSSDTLGQWIEIYNASGGTVSLSGLSVTLRKIDGSSATSFFVRGDEDVAAGGYATLGRYARGSEPSFVSYGFLPDGNANFPSAASMELRACGVLIDKAIYRSLPASGSWGFDGARTPDAQANDTESAWCADTQGTGKPGTPLMRNHTCAAE